MALSINFSYAQKVTTSHYPWFPFQWLGSKISGKYHQKLAMAIPVSFNDRKGNMLLQFDLGTTKESWQQLAATKLPIDSLVAGSWGKKTKFYKGMIKSKVYLGTTQLKNPSAWYSDNQLLEDFYKSEKLFALVGNSLFFEDVVVIDFKNAKFGILKKKRVL